MQKLTRNIGLTFRVTEEERDFIRRKMQAAGIANMNLYLLKMAVTGKIFTIDMTEVRECSRLLRHAGNNVNQLAKRANEGGSVHSAALADVQARLSEVWRQQDKIIKTLTELLEAENG
jgi:hypothetical protein